MKIIYLHQYFTTPTMSGGTRSYEMARRLAEAGHEVHVISSYRENDRQDGRWWNEILDGFTIHWLSVPYSNKLNYRKRIMAFIRFAWSSARKAHRVGGDVVFATSTPLTIALPGIYASKRLKIPMVFEVRDLWPELPIAIGALNNFFLIKLAKWLEKFAYRNSAHVVALSPGMAAGVRATGFPDDQISIISNGADITLFGSAPGAGASFINKHSYLNAGPLIIYAGTLGVINGVCYLVDIAFEMLSIDPLVRFLIVGDGKELSLVRKRAEECGVLKKNLWILPPLAKNQMPALFSAATISTSLFIDLPEMWNNSANKFFDSLAAGKPVMINYQGWQAELLEEFGAGVVVPPHSPKQAAITIHALLCDEQRLEECQQAARKLAETKFDRDKLAAKLVSVLEKVADVPAKYY